MEYTTDNDGSRCTYLDGKLHSYKANDSSFALPAIIRIDGDQEWWQNGKIHRDNDLPAKICANGNQYWYKNGKIHRDTPKDGSFALPAIIRNDKKAEWWINGEKIKECDNYQPKVKSARR